MQSPTSRGVPERFAVAVRWRHDEAGGPPSVALRRSETGGWGLPRERVAPGETDVEAVVRAGAAHAGAPVGRPGRFLGTVRAAAPAGVPRAILDCWAVADDTGADGGEPWRWLPAGDASDLADDEDDRAVLARFADGPAEIGRLLLLRHAPARAPIGGPDDERPLTADGQVLAARLASVVAAHAPDRLCTSPALRCRDTVAPAAATLGLPASADDRLAEHGGDGAGTAARLEEAARRGEHLVVCTHAPVVGDLLERLTAARPELLPRPARLDAGGAWSLEFAREGIVGARYLAPPPLAAAVTS